MHIRFCDLLHNLQSFFIVIRAMEIAMDKGWSKLWIEMIQSLLHKLSMSLLWYFGKSKTIGIFAWPFLHKDIFSYHKYIENGIYLVICFANLDLTWNSLTIFYSIPIGIRKDFIQNILKLFFLDLLLFEGLKVSPPSLL